MSDTNQPNAPLDDTRKPIKDYTWLGWVGVAGACLVGITTLPSLEYRYGWQEPVLLSSLGLLLFDMSKQALRSWLLLRRQRKEQAEQRRRKR